MKQKLMDDNDEDDVESLKGGGIDGIKGEEDVFSKFTYQDEDNDDVTMV